MSNDLVQMNLSFDYALVSEENRLEACVNAEIINTGAKQLAEGMVELGKRLIRQQELLMQENDGKHGLFEEWIEKGCILKRRNVFRHMAIAKHYESLTEKVPPAALFPPSVIDEMLSASDEVIEQVTANGHIPTRSEVREAKRTEREALEKARQAEEAKQQAKIEEAKARADALAAQQQLLFAKEASEREIAALSQQNAELEEKMATLVIPEVEIRTVEREVLPQSAINEMTALREKLAEAEEIRAKELQALQDDIEKLSADLAAQSKAISPEAQKKIDALQKQHDKLKDEYTKLTKDREQQEERIKRLNADIDAAIRKREFAENADRIRQVWRTATSETHSTLMRLLGQWPTPIDVQTFDADDWARVDHLKRSLRRVLEECEQLRSAGGQVVEDDISNNFIESYMAYSEG